MRISYIDKHGLTTLIKQIKKGQTGAYHVKGRAIYADEAFLALAAADKEAIATGASVIDALGLWQPADGTWKKVEGVEEGAVFDVINKFLTDSDFREGAGHEVGSGTNIVAVNTGTAAAPVIKWDLLTGILDLDRYQTKKLVNYVDMFENELDAEPADSSELPTVAPKEEVKDGTIAVIGGTGLEAGDVYEAEVSEIENDPVHVNVTWLKLGNMTTVEGALSLISMTCPNRPLTDEEIEDIWANA